MSSKPRFVGDRRLVELGSICELVMGQSPSSDTYNADGEGLPFYQGNADFGEKNPIPHVWCTEPKKVAEKGDILVSVRAPIGAINIASEQCCIGRGVAAIRLRLDFVSADFLMHQLLASRKNLELMGTGSTFKAVGKKALNGFAISIYPKGDQDKIADQLDCIIQQIKATETQVAQLDQLVKSRFVEMFGDPDSNPHGLEVCPLGKVLSVQPSNGMYKPQKDYVSDGSGTPIIRIDSFRNEGPDYSSLKRLNCNESERRRYGINENDIVINRVNSVGCMGKTMLVSHIPEATVFESNMMRLHSDETLMIPAFLCAQMTSEFSKSYFEANAKRAIGQASINQKDVKGLPVLVPTIGNQKAYLSFVARVDKSRFIAQQQIEKLQMLYNSLAQDYFGD